MRRSRPSPLVLIVLALAAGVPAGATGALAEPAGGASGDRGGFIVTLRPGADASATAREWRGKGVEVSHIYSHALRGFAGRMGSDMAERVRRDHRVSRLEVDGPVLVSGTQTSAPWGLDRVDQAARPLDGSYTYDTTAREVTLYVVDTGVRATHTDFGGRVGSGYSAISDGRGTDDCNGHGTHVAGSAGGTTHGVAKAVAIIPVRVLDCNGSGTMSGVIAGVDWIIAHHVAGVPAVANMSLGGGANSTLDGAVRSAVADGVTFVVAAGNENTDACTKSPARVAEALTVASTTSGDVRSSFSNFGSCVDLFAPGSGIVSTYHTSDAATTTLSGTSMASPHVAGIASLYLAGAPAATPATVQSAVITGATANVVTDPVGSPNLLAYSRLSHSSPPATAPATPAAPAATAAKKAIGVSWVAPADGGSPITGYTVRVHRASDGAVIKTASVSAPATSVSVGGLSAGTSYYATVRANNAVGSSNWSPASNRVTALR